MALSIRELIAHAFTPWEWRSRASVVALVILAGAVMVVGPILVLTNEIEPLAKALNIVLGEVFAYFVGLRPALRSLRAWDDAHPTRLDA